MVLVTLEEHRRSYIQNQTILNNVGHGYVKLVIALGSLVEHRLDPLELGGHVGVGAPVAEVIQAEKGRNFFLRLPRWEGANLRSCFVATN